MKKYAVNKVEQERAFTVIKALIQARYGKDVSDYGVNALLKKAESIAYLTNQISDKQDEDAFTYLSQAYLSSKAILRKEVLTICGGDAYIRTALSSVLSKYVDNCMHVVLDDNNYKGE